jgi:hypothetical protein
VLDQLFNLLHHQFQRLLLSQLNNQLDTKSVINLSKSFILLLERMMQPWSLMRPQLLVMPQEASGSIRVQLIMLLLVREHKLQDTFLKQMDSQLLEEMRMMLSFSNLFFKE